MRDVFYAISAAKTETPANALCYYIRQIPAIHFADRWKPFTFQWSVAVVHACIRLENFYRTIRKCHYLSGETSPYLSLSANDLYSRWTLVQNS